jgi:hypothetical protein
MYKKSADLIHLNERTGSHATKGPGRGTVPHMIVPDPEAFDRKELVMRKKLLEHQLYPALGEYTASIKIYNDAVERHDISTVKAVRPTMRAFRSHVKRIKREIANIKEILMDHPTPLHVRRLTKKQRRLLTAPSVSDK